MNLQVTRAQWLEGKKNDTLVGWRAEGGACVDGRRERKWTETFNQTPEEKNKSMPGSVPHHRRSGKVQKSGQTRVMYHARPEENRADGNGHSPSRYFLEIVWTGEGQTAKSPLDVEAAVRGGTGVDPCSALVDV